MFKRFPFFYQRDRMDCGPVCLKMISKYYGKDYQLDYFRKICQLDKAGVSFGKLKDACQILGFKTMMVNVTIENLNNLCNPPCILHWNNDHFVVFVGKKRSKYIIADPGYGIISLPEEEFLNNWKGLNGETGVVFLLAPTDEFFSTQNINSSEKSSWYFLYKYVKEYKKHLIKLGVSVFLGNLLSLAFPFLTQLLVDEGVTKKNLSIVLYIILAQSLLYIGEMTIEFIRGRLLLYVSTRVSISIVSSFLTKMMNLPIGFFDTKSTGDINQRIQDHERIEDFLTGSSINVIFYILNIILLSIVIFIYSVSIFLIFSVLSLISVAWIVLFLKKRKIYDYIKFKHLRESQDTIYEIINGIQEIKLNLCEDIKKEKWQNAQNNLFKINNKVLKLEQYQQIGFKFLNYTKNLIIIYVASKEVINDNMTLGMLLSISYIIGQANVPLQQLIPFSRSLQDTKISLDRLQEIYNLKAESEQNNNQINTIDGGIKLENVSFRYGGRRSPFVLENLNLEIPKGKITAIVGTSGSGKTTLLKLLLKFYNPTSGNLYLNEDNFNNINSESWRERCGIVMQSGFIFSDTIENNISMRNENDKNLEKVKCAVTVSNIKDFIERNPLKYKARLENAGSSISMGQKQRILIARAVYKNPDYIFLDEATSALDANNEKVIIQELDRFFQGKTVVVIAHRLSTVKHADQIVVLENGRIKEIGRHDNLVQKKGYYFNLVKNQLELGN